MTATGIDPALAALRRGGLVIVVDALDRENEGDLICAAETITPEIVDFMLRIGRGVLCVPLTHEAADRLQLTHAVSNERNTAPHQTQFLVQVDHRESGTGVSPSSRAKTIRALADPHSVPGDFVQPGHVSPLLAKDGGVLRRAGHTEATVDLVRMAGLRPVGVLIEVCSQRHFGMASFAELEELAAKHDIPDHLDRRADPLPAAPRTAHPTRSRSCHPNQGLRHADIDRLQRRPRGPGTAGPRVGRPAGGHAAAARADALLVLHRATCSVRSVATAATSSRLPWR